MKDAGTYYDEQAVTLGSEEVVENEVDERKEEQTEAPQMRTWLARYYGMWIQFKFPLVQLQEHMPRNSKMR